jgi:hypothetical protein
MKCRVIKDAKGKVIAAFPVSKSGARIEVEPTKGQRVVEMDIPLKDLKDPKRFLRACSGGR